MHLYRWVLTMSKFAHFSKTYLIYICLLFFFGLSNAKNDPALQKNIPMVKAVLKTTDAQTIGETTNDPAFYLNQNTPRKSLVIGANGVDGVSVYNLKGKEVQHLTVGNVTDIDIRNNFRFNGHNVALVAASNKTTNTVNFFAIDTDSEDLSIIANSAISTGLTISDICMYANRNADDFFIFATSEEGQVIQWQILTDLEEIQLEYVRSFSVGSDVEGCVADDRYHDLYIAEANVGIWRYDAKPRGFGRTAIDRLISQGGNLAGPVAGLALYKTQNGGGYLIASSQGDNSFAVYERKSNDYRGKFQVKFNNSLVKLTDGIDITSQYLNSTFPNGMLVIEDSNPDQIYQSYKYVPWNRIAPKFFPPLDKSERQPPVF